MNSEPYDQTLFDSLLNKKLISRIHYFQSVDSTNTFLRNLKNLQNFELALAETQTSGRGRRGRVWKDEPFQNLLFSFSYRSRDLTDTFTLIPLITALSIAKTCQLYLNHVEIKWPNDVKVNGKKISGILVESKINVNESVFIIGVGLNINQSEFDPEISEISTSFFLESEKKHNRGKILTEILEQLIFNLNRLESNDLASLLAEYTSLCSTVNKMISYDYQNITETGFAVGIQKDGALLIEKNGTVTSYHGNEIFYIRSIS